MLLLKLSLLHDYEFQCMGTKNDTTSACSRIDPYCKNTLKVLEKDEYLKSQQEAKNYKQWVLLCEQPQQWLNSTVLSEILHTYTYAHKHTSTS